MSLLKTVLVVGLGNPGGEYQNSRHNTGFFAVDMLAKELKAGDWTKNKFKAETAKVINDSVHYILVKPLTFMNLSGEAVSKIASYNNVASSDIWVIHDDLDLPLGKVQIRFGGGLAGHHGLESIAEQLATTAFGRVRIGIRGHELRDLHAQNDIDTNQFVMGDFLSSEKNILDEVIAMAITALIKNIEKDTPETISLTTPNFPVLPI